MKTRPRLIIIPLLILFAAIMVNSCGETGGTDFTSILDRNPYTSEYNASDGVTPDRAPNAAWKPYKTISNSADVKGGALVINTGEAPADLSGFFTQGGEELTAPTPGNPWIINISLKHELGTGIGNSSHSQITFNPFAGQSGTIEIGQDEIYIRGSENSHGASAKRDTDNGFHDYTIVVYHDGLVELYYDEESEPVITGALVYQPGVPVRIAFGDIVTDASGVSYWKHVKHNAGKKTQDDTGVEFNYIYDASFGHLPSETCWDLITTLSTTPAIDNGVLKIESGTNPLDFTAFHQTSLTSPAEGKPWVIQANAKYGQGVTNHTARAHMQVTFSPFPDLNLMNALQIGQDEFFLLSTPLTKGNTAIRDTDDDYHTYRIEVRYDNVTENDWVIEVYYDNEETPAITGNLVDWTPYGSFPMRIYFGDHTTSAYGTSYWKSVRHNASDGTCDPDIQEPNITYTSIYHAQSGTLPEDTCWKLNSTGSGNSSSFVNNSLVLNSSNLDGNYYFYYQDTDLVPLTDEPWVIEARVRYVSGGHNPTKDNLRHIDIAFTATTGTRMSGVLQIGKDEIFLNIDDFTRGPKITVDTDDDFHTYRIEAYPDYTVKVFYDNSEDPVLTGNLYYASYMNTLRIYFGDGTSYAHGVSEWEYVRHNAYNGTCSTGCSSASGTYNAIYEAQSGILPDSTIWSKGGSSGESSGYSSFYNGALFINSGTNVLEFEKYAIEGPENLVSPESGKPWIIEVNARYGDGYSNHPARAPMQVSFVPFPDLLNSLQIRDGEFFLLTDPLTAGSPAYRDTSGAFHTYTIKAYTDGSVEVFYDSEESPALTGNLVDWSPYSSVPVRISFGDGTTSAYGTSYWNYVKFNFYNSICTTSMP